MPDTTPDDRLDMVQDAATLAYAVWRRTDFDRIDAHRSLDDEFASRIATAAYTDSVASFIDRLASKWGVRSFDDRHADVRTVIERYDRDGDVRAFLRTVRNNPALVVLEMKHEYQSDDADSNQETLA